MTAKQKMNLIIDINKLIKVNQKNDLVVKFYQKELQKVLDTQAMK